MADDYWEQWQTGWMKTFIEVDKACDQFLHERNGWSLVKYRWDNPDRLLSGLVQNGVWGNIHILFIPDNSIFRLTYSAWRDEDKGTDVYRTYRVSKRFWVTSDDDGGKDRFLKVDASAEVVKRSLDEAWDRLLGLSKHGKFLREETIMLPL
jgi:hypothetical protein